MNQCAHIGRLTATPELKQTPSGKSVCNFTLAVERRFGNADGTKTVDYIEFVAWNSQAIFLCKWFDKGVRVAVTGELQTRMYEKDGKKIKVYEIMANTVEFADGKREANEVTTDTTSQESTPDVDDGFGFIPMSADDGLPFF
jgi:single-strand DNA-binding protein